MWPYLEIGFCNRAQVKVSPLGWALQHACCPYKKGKCGHTGRIEGRRRSWEEMKNRARYKPWRDAQSRSFLPSPQKEPTLSVPWFWTSGLQNFQTLTFLLFKLPSCEAWLHQPQETNWGDVDLFFWLRELLFRTTIPVLWGRGEEISDYL